MPTVVSTRPTGIPNLLVMVTRVRQEVTKETLVSLNDDPVNNVIVHALNDAVDDIYARFKWQWSKVVGNISLTSLTSDYNLPFDFQRMASEPEIGSIKLREVDAEEWTHYTASPSLASAARAYGSPTLYMIDRGFIRFYPTPSDAFIAQQPAIGIFYYKQPPARLVLTSDSASAFDVPVAFQEALHRHAVAKLKMFLHYDDWKVDEDRYEFIIQKQISNDTVSVHPSRVRPRNRYSANYG